MIRIKATGYPWSKWFDAMKPKNSKTRQEDYPTLMLHQGKDYECMTHSMTMQFRRQAYKRGCRVSCQIREGGDALEVMIVKEN